jgi:predicted peptidase
MNNLAKTSLSANRSVIMLSFRFSIIISLILLVSAHGLQAQDLDLYQKRFFIKGTDTLRYRVLYPENYKEGTVYPLIVFLHGSGERGNDNESQLSHGGDLFLKDTLRKRFPAIVIFPQSPADSNWSVFKGRRDGTAAFNHSLNTNDLTTPERLVKLLMDSLSQHGIADKKRLYIGGLSLGGFGTYDLVIHYPDYFAAAFPICGQANIPLYVSKASAVPLWIFHGALDNVVSPQPDRDLEKALLSAGVKNVKYTEYPNANHNSWDACFAEPELLPWLFSKHK